MRTRNEAGEHALEPGLRRAGNRSRARMLKHQQRRAGVASVQTAVHAGRTESVQQPADGRPGDRGHLECTGVPCNGAREVLPRHEEGQQGLARRAEERLARRR